MAWECFYILHYETATLLPCGAAYSAPELDAGACWGALEWTEKEFFTIYYGAQNEVYRLEMGRGMAEGVYL